ncbi:hypothetical protein [Actinomadura sp. NEAU-AAG7]|uniref:hypothetical protein n=1 Tax=Actinomadura sp. NEAU-AAG7 TaxID=2839640 RepID=UPI001BE428B6|nr:hypothetical protein [Actinomadura sp. NEAU-AAG7]MBT2210370.1 hypothetical protein [Actinomadura sp. NEAU-AAG7]
MTAETTDKARRAAERATKAEEAAEAARLAEEAAARAREAARLAQIAAEAAAAEAEAEPEAEVEPEAARSAETPSGDGEAPQGSAAPIEGAADGSAPPEAASAAAETSAETSKIDLRRPTGAEAGEPSKEATLASVAESTESTASPESAKTGTVLDESGGDGAEEGAPKRRRVRVPRVRAEGRGSGALRSGTLVVVLVGLVLALGGATTMLALKVRDQKATETASRQGLFAASRAAQALSSYDYRSLDSDLKAGAAMTTGRLRGEFEKLAETLKTLAPRERAVSSTTVMKAGVVSASPDRVVALVYANRTSQTASDKQQRLPEPLRIRLTMVKERGKWLASELAVIS